MTLANSGQLRRDQVPQAFIIEPVHFATLDDAVNSDIRGLPPENHAHSDNTNVRTRGRTRSGSPIRSQSRPTRRDEPDTVEDRSLPRPPVNVSLVSNVFRRLRSPSASNQQQLLMEQHAETSTNYNVAAIQQYLTALNPVPFASASTGPKFILAEEDKLLLSNLKRRFAALGEDCPEKFKYKPAGDEDFVRILTHFAKWLNVKRKGSLTDYSRSQPVTDSSNLYHPATVFDLFRNDGDLKLRDSYRTKLRSAINKFKYLLEWERGKQLSQMTGYDSFFVENSSAPKLASDARNIVSLRLDMSLPKEKDDDILKVLPDSRHKKTLLAMKFLIKKEFGIDESLSIVRSEEDWEFTEALEVIFKADKNIAPDLKNILCLQ